MTIFRDELDKIEEPIPLLRKMSRDTFYSYEEMVEKILGKSFSFKEENLLNDFREKFGEKETETEDLMAWALGFTRNIARVEAVLAIHIITGDIVLGFKGNEIYYGKSE